MEAEVQAAIIKASSDWALYIVNNTNPPPHQKPEARIELDSLQNTFRLAYEKIGNVVEP